MTWQPNAVVTVAGVDYTDKSLWNVQVNYGRTSVWEQARAGYATVQIVNLNNANLNFEINDSLVVTIQNATGTPVTVFTGVVNDISNNLVGVGSTAKVGVQTLTAVAPFAIMARAIVGNAAYPKEYDDDRLTRIFNEAGVTIDVVDTPPIYEFTARAASQPTDAYSLASYYAGMAMGYIYETADGKVGYANESRRTLEVAVSGYLTLPLSYILGQGITSNKSLNNITNQVELQYKNSQIKTQNSTASIASYGLKAATIVTELELAVEAQYQADRYVALRAYPITNLSSFTIQLDMPVITNADLNTLLNVYMGQAIAIVNLPNAIMHAAYDGFVEGYQLSFNEYQAALTLITTDATLSLTPTRWQDVDPTLEWLDVDPALEWYEYQ